MGNISSTADPIFALQSQCFYCGLPFNTIERPRHHCRNCGASICDRHSHFPPGTYRELRTCYLEKRIICQARRDYLIRILKNNYEAYHAIAATEEDWNETFVQTHSGTNLDK